MPHIQLDLDFHAVTSGKKTERLSIPCSSAFLKFLDMEADLLGTDRAKLAHRFVLEGLQKGLGKLFMAEPFTEDVLSDLMNKGSHFTE